MTQEPVQNSCYFILAIIKAASPQCPCKVFYTGGILDLVLQDAKSIGLAIIKRILAKQVNNPGQLDTIVWNCRSKLLECAVFVVVKGLSAYEFDYCAKVHFSGGEVVRVVCELW